MPTINVGDKVRITNKGTDPDMVGYHAVWVQVVETVTDEQVATTNGHHFYFNERNFEVLEAAPKPELPSEVGALVIGTVRGEAGVPVFRATQSEWRSLTRVGGALWHEDENITDWVAADVTPKA